MPRIGPGERRRNRRYDPTLSVVLWCTTLFLLAGCGDGDSTTGARAVPFCGGSGPLVPVAGHAFVFGPYRGNLTGATITAAEAPAFATTVQPDGSFHLEVPSGSDCSFVLTQPGFHTTQTAVLHVGASGIEQVGFQVPTDRTFDLLSLFVDLDPAQCQIATTVSALGTTPYGGNGLGVPGVVTRIDPPLGPEHGPVYFNYVNNGIIYPDPTLTQTSIDGGVAYVDVPPAEYVVSATKDGKRFSSVRLRCHPGIVVNGSPPWGLQELP